MNNELKDLGVATGNTEALIPEQNNVSLLYQEALPGGISKQNIESPSMFEMAEKNLSRPTFPFFNADVNKKNGRGYQTSFRQGEGNILQTEMNRNKKATIVFSNTRLGKRFCETCGSHKPKGKRKAVKGWKCDDCADGR